jgi:hypothetical protein
MGAEGLGWRVGQGESNESCIKYGQPLEGTKQALCLILLYK